MSLSSATQRSKLIGSRLDRLSTSLECPKARVSRGSSANTTLRVAVPPTVPSPIVGMVPSAEIASTPGRIYKNQGMPGHMGDETKTAQNLRVIQVRLEDNALLVSRCGSWWQRIAGGCLYCHVSRDSQTRKAVRVLKAGLIRRRRPRRRNNLLPTHSHP